MTALALRRVPRVRGRTSVWVTVVLGAGLALLAFRTGRWAVVDAIWTLPPGASSSVCRALAREGACWAVVTERFRFILFGAYPFAEHWRPALVCLLFASLYAASAVPAWWTPRLLGLWVAVPVGSVVLLRGGLPGLRAVPSELWGGLPLTFVLSTVGFSAAFPFGILLALGRRSRLPVVRALCGAYVELMRGVPFIAFLFMTVVMFPLFVPPGLTIDKLLRAQIALVMVMAAYLAEVVRAGLRAVPEDQTEAAASLGLRYWPTTTLVVLPQAFRVSIPALANTFIAFFKDTSLVAVIGLFDLLGAAKAVIVDPRWVGFGVEVYLFVAAVYFVPCQAVSRCSRRLELALRVRGLG